MMAPGCLLGVVLGMSNWEKISDLTLENLSAGLGTLWYPHRGSDWVERGLGICASTAATTNLDMDKQQKMDGTDNFSNYCTNNYNHRPTVKEVHMDVNLI